MAAVAPAVVPEKRRASSRLREQPATRLRTALEERPNTSAQKPKEKKAPTRKPPAPSHSDSPKITDLLPSKPSDTAPLPTLGGIDEELLAGAKLQSIADSGVLSASLARSRQRWVQDFMFEKYWSKATYKKKKEPVDEKPSAKETRPPMTKIGTCKMIAEPHTFDVSIFVVRDPSAPQAPGDRQFVVQYGSPSNQFSKAPAPAATPRQAAHPNPSYIAGTPTTSKPVYNPPFTHQPQSLGASPASARPSAAPATPSTLRTSVGADQTSINRAQPVAQTRPSPAGSPQSSRKPAPVPAPAPTPQAPTDPVIQMLAQRATTDNALKQVMKIVASGKASQKQLDYFQGHIDELTRIVNERQAEEARRGTAAPQQRPQQSIVTPMAVTQVQRPIAPTYPAPKASPKAPVQFRQAFNPQPITPKPRSIPPPTHVLIEFGVNQADRYLFPRNSILEYEPDGAVRVSFFVVKKRADLPSANPLLGKKYVRKKKAKADESKPNEESSADKMDLDGPEKKELEGPNKGDAETAAAQSTPKTDAGPAQTEAEVSAAKAPEQPKKDVFQPVTIRFEQPSDPTMLHVFGRVVAPPSEVVKWMTDVVARCDRATTAQLALRLPRGSEKESKEAKEAPAQVVAD